MKVILRVVAAILFGLGATTGATACGGASEQSAKEFSRELQNDSISQVKDLLELSLTEYLPQHHPELAAELGVDDTNNFEITAIPGSVPRTYDTGETSLPNHEGYGVYSVKLLSDCNVQIMYWAELYGNSDPSEHTPYWAAAVDTADGSQKVAVWETQMFGDDAYMTPDFWRFASNFCLLPRGPAT